MKQTQKASKRRILRFLLPLVIWISFLSLEARPVQPRRVEIGSEPSSSSNGSHTTAAHHSDAGSPHHEIVVDTHHEPRRERTSYLQYASRQHYDYAAGLEEGVTEPFAAFRHVVGPEFQPFQRNAQESFRHAHKLITGVTNDVNTGGRRRLTTKERLASGGVGVLHGIRAVSHSLEGGVNAIQAAVTLPASLLNRATQILVHDTAANSFSAAHHIQETGSKCIGALCHAAAKIKKCAQGSCTRVAKVVRSAKDKLRKGRKASQV
jgi:hypothetical protein